jgi:hypothetical protein
MGTIPKAMKEVFGGMPRSRIALWKLRMHSPGISRAFAQSCSRHARSARPPALQQKSDLRVAESPLLARLSYCRSRISSIATLPPLSTLMTLWTGLNPVRLISTM